MPKLPIISGKELIKYLINEKGFKPRRIKGDHYILRSKKIPMLPVPLYPKLDRSALSNILAEAEIENKEFIQYWEGN